MKIPNWLYILIWCILPFVLVFWAAGSNRLETILSLWIYIFSTLFVIIKIILSKEWKLFAFLLAYFGLLLGVLTSFSYMSHFKGSGWIFLFNIIVLISLIFLSSKKTNKKVFFVIMGLLLVVNLGYAIISMAGLNKESNMFGSSLNVNDDWLFLEVSEPSNSEPIQIARNNFDLKNNAENKFVIKVMNTDSETYSNLIPSLYCNFNNEYLGLDLITVGTESAPSETSEYLVVLNLKANQQFESGQIYPCKIIMKNNGEETSIKNKPLFITIVD